MEKEELFLVFTDVVGSTVLDAKGDSSWRISSFTKQLSSLLSIDNSLALKSIGDALFIIIRKNIEKDKVKLCREILARTYEAYLKVKETDTNDSLMKQPVKIRAVVHLITGHKSGKDIAKEIENSSINEKKFKILTQSLRNDIFGTEVNKAARIQSLVKKDAILVTEEIAKLIQNDESFYFSKLKNLHPLEFDFDERNFILHSPVPVTRLKGLEHINVHLPVIVWQLNENFRYDNNDIKRDIPVLSVEFKFHQVLRFLMVGLKRRIQFEEIEIASKQISELIKPLDNDIVSKFYNDLIWDVIDEIEISAINFKRYSINDKKELPIVRQTLFSGTYFAIKRNGTQFELINGANKKNKNYGTNLIISHMILCSYPSKEIADINRELFEKNKTEKELIKYIEPQTLDIYKPITILEYEVNKVSDDYFIMLFFGVYIQKLSEANDQKKLFEGINSNEHFNNPKPVIYGLNTGLVDGFVLYRINTDTIKNNKICEIYGEPLNNLLNQYFPSYLDNTFYTKTFPISIFLLKNNVILSKDKTENINLLKMVKSDND